MEITWHYKISTKSLNNIAPVSQYYTFTSDLTTTQLYNWPNWGWIDDVGQ